MSALADYIPLVERELNGFLEPLGFNARPYQIECLAALDQYWENNSDKLLNPLLWLATGLGKTVIFSMLIRLYFQRYQGLRIVIIAGNKELVEQAEEKVFTVFPNAPVGVYCSSLNRKEIAPITIATRGSIANNVQAFGYQNIVLVDECDEIPESESSQYKKIIAKLREYNPALPVIGFTATPFWQKDVIYKNGSSKDDKKIFDDVVYKKDLRWGIDNGFLVPPITQAVNAGEVDTSKIKISGGDFNQKELEEATERHELVEGAVKEWYEKAFLMGRKLTVFFCTSVKHAQMVSKSLMANYGIDAPVIHGNTGKTERDNILKQMKQGSLAAVCNVNVLTRGTDVPNIDCLAVLRATNSLRLIIQIIGRGLRLFDGKTDCLVLDFGENAKRFGALDKAMPPKRKNEPARVKPCPECNTQNSVFAVKCTHCGHKLKKQPSKQCASCNEPNPIGAKVCINCNQPFVTHSASAAHNAIVSSDDLIAEYPVQKMEFQLSITRNKDPYIKAIFYSEIFNVYFMPLYFHTVRAQNHSLQTLIKLITQDLYDAIPTVHDPKTVLDFINSHPAHHTPPKTITVDMASKYKDIVGMGF